MIWPALQKFPCDGNLRLARSNHVAVYTRVRTAPQHPPDLQRRERGGPFSRSAPPPRPSARRIRDTGERQRSSRVFEKRSDVASRAVTIRRQSSVPQHQTAGSRLISASPAPKVKAFPSNFSSLAEVCSLGATKTRHFRFMSLQTPDAPRKSIHLSHYVRAPLRRPDLLRASASGAGLERSQLDCSPDCSPDCSKELNTRV